MDFSNDPIGELVEQEMKILKSKGVVFEQINSYKMVFEAIYELYKQIEELKKAVSDKAV